MADLKTTQEERARLRDMRADFYSGAGADVDTYLGARLLDDVDTLLAERESLRSTMGGLIACNEALLAENAKLRAVAEAVPEVLRHARFSTEDGHEALDALATALEAP